MNCGIAPPAAEILDFWFLPVGDHAHGQQRKIWFQRNAVFDAEIRTRFGAMVESALADPAALADWEAVPRGALALILLLDQFTRNIYRDSARAYAGDPRAQAVASRLTASGGDRALPPAERQFAYMPFMHAESAELQQRSVELFAALAAEAGSAYAGDYARRHRDIVLRFGRFPHRNEVLGRASTADERAFLEMPGSRF